MSVLKGFVYANRPEGMNRTVSLPYDFGSSEMKRDVREAAVKCAAVLELMIKLGIAKD